MEEFGLITINGKHLANRLTRMQLTGTTQHYAIKHSQHWVNVVFGLLWSLMVLSTSLAHAEESHLKLKAETSLSTDDNLFRLPANTNRLAALGVPDGGEQITQTGLTLTFSTALSLQKLEASISVVDYKYRTFNQLSFMAYNYNLALRWSMTPQLQGVLSTTRNETLNSFSDVVGARQNNQRVDVNQNLNAVWSPGGPWRISTGVSRFRQTNAQQLVAGGDIEAASAEAGLSYVAASGSSISMNQKSTQGHYTNKILVATNPYDTDYHQSQQDVRFHWVLPNNSQADFQLSHLAQSHPNFSLRDFNGLNFGTDINWLLSAKSSIALGRSRSTGSYATNFSNYTETQKLYVSPTWQMSPHTSLRWRSEWAQIDYLGLNMPFLLSRKDATRDYQLSLTWQPEQRFTVSASLQNLNRTSNQTGLDYESQQVVLSAQYFY